eukprot:sb/3475262/
MVDFTFCIFLYFFVFFVWKKTRILGSFVFGPYKKIQKNRLEPPRITIHLCTVPSSRSAVDARSIGTLNKFSIRLGTFLRRYPTARLMVICYMFLLHTWVVVILLTYSPEVHDHGPSGEVPAPNLVRNS